MEELNNSLILSYLGVIGIFSFGDAKGEGGSFLFTRTIKMCLGIPGQITEITDINQKLALVSVGGVKRQVNIACIVNEQHPAESCVGDWVLVHVGFAMNRINEKEAAETLKLLEELAEAMG